MIITDKLAWYHLPKTAGTTTDKLFHSSGLSLNWNDDQSSFLKHLPPKEHPSFELMSLTGRQPVVNFRRLPYWLVSNYQHKLLRMGLVLPIEPISNGFFWRERQKKWLPADWWIKRFGIDLNWSFLRVEALKSDFLKCLSSYQPISLCKQIQVYTCSSKNKSFYNRSLSKWFSANDLLRIYDANPLWARLEEKLYGSLIKLSSV